MATLGKTLFGLVLVAGAAALLLRGCGQEAAPPAAGPQVAANAANGAELASGATSGTAREATPQRDAVPAAASSAAWLDHPYTLELDVLVVDPLGLPVQGHSLRLSVPHGTMNDAPVASGPDGRLSMRWPSRVASGSVVLVDGHDTRRTVAVQHGSKTRVTLLGARSGGGPELVISFAQEGAGTTLALSNAVVNQVRFVRDFDAPKAGTEPAAPSGLHPFVVFDTRAAVAKVETAALVEALVIPETVFDVSSVQSSLFFANHMRSVFNASRAANESAAAETPAAVRIAGTVFGDDGKPVAKLPVVLLGQGPQPVQQVETDGAGQFVFEGLAAAEFTVRAGGTEAGLATAPAVTTVGTTSVVLNLQRGSCVRGKALRADGTPLAKAAVSWRANDGTWCDETTTHGDGSFAFANLPGSAGTVLLWAPEDASPLPIASAANVLCDSGELVLRAAEAGSAMRIEPVLPEGVDGAVSVRLWNLDLGLGKPVPGPEAGKPYEFDKLAAGWYRVELHHAATGWIDAGRFWLDGKANAELGRVLLPAPARVKIEVDPALLPGKDQQRAEVCSLRPDVDVRLAGVDAADTLLLPAGDYVFAWRGADGAVHFHRFAAVAGRELTVRPMY